jgi:hypothetical protein
MERANRREKGAAGGAEMRRQVLALLISVGASLLSGAIFLVAFFHQFALVEVAASLLTWLQVFFLSSAIGDALEPQQKTNRARSIAVISLALGLAAFFVITDLSQSMK